MYPEDGFDPAGMLAEHFLRLQFRQPPHLLAQHRDLGLAEQIGEDQKPVALELRHLRRGQFHRHLHDRSCVEIVEQDQAGLKRFKFPCPGLDPGSTSSFASVGTRRRGWPGQARR
jgi:hypothetical protein